MENAMNDHETVARTEHVGSVGTRISWGAIFAGCMTALGMYFLLMTLGAAVGLSITERTNPTTLHTGAIAWAFLTTISALFVGGVVTSLFTTGEDRVEAMLHGVIMWAVLFTMLLLLGAAGIQSGFNAMAAMASTAHDGTSVHNGTARADDKAGNAAEIPQEVKEAATRVTWWAFIGTWVSMMAGAIGGLVGAGPTFRMVTVRSSTHRMAVG